MAAALGAIEGTDVAEQQHELHTFLAQDLETMASEYNRIRGRSTEDHGTAGDEGEEAWAALLRDWLPDSYQIRTKGRILGANGASTGQVDIIILRPGYPQRLLDKKLYLAGGVAAVFECKNTLKAAHFAKTWTNIAAVNALEQQTAERTPRTALTPNIFYGLLAHGHSWNKPKSDPYGVIRGKLQTLLNDTAKMRDALSLLCVANLGSWAPLRMSYDGPELQGWEARKQRNGLTSDEPLCSIAYATASTNWETFVPSNPLGVLISRLIGRLAFSDETLRPLSQYFYAAGMAGLGKSVVGRSYPLATQYPPELVAQLPDALTNGVAGSEWSLAFAF